MDLLFELIVNLLVQSATNAANSPSVKSSYQEKMPESVRKLKQY